MATCSRRPATQLARVSDRSPLLVTLRTSTRATNEAPPSLCVVKIRSTLLHFVADGHLRCVIRSKVPITDVADYGIDCSSDSNSGGEECHKILVSAADGNVWVVTLPAKLQPGVGVLTGDLLLERSSSSECGGGTVQWFCQLPGVQSVEHASAGSGLTSLTLMRSLVTPSTLIVSTRGSPESKLQRHQSLELDEIEGEQSTCTLCLNSQDSRHGALIAILFPDVAKYAGAAAILQGDLDGWVRFSLIHYPSGKGDVAKASVIRSGALVRLDQPVQMIAPFTASALRASLTRDSNSNVLSAFNALLVLGTRGQIGIVDLRNGEGIENLLVSPTQLCIGHPVQSLVFVSNLEVCVYCSSGSAFVCRAADLLLEKHRAVQKVTVGLSDSLRAFAEKLSLPPGVLRLETHDNGHGLSVLFSSGRIVTFDEVELRAMVSPVLLKTSGTLGPAPRADLSSNSRVCNILHRIAQVSTESYTLRAESKETDHQLKAQHSALEMLRLARTKGVEAVVKCELDAAIVTTGNFSTRQTVKLMFSLRFVNPEAVVSSDQWCLCLYVRTRKCSVTSYSFPLEDILAGRKSIILNPDMFALQDQGALWVSCSLVFCPSGHVEIKYSGANNIDSTEQEGPFSFAIPLIHDRRFMIAQLSQPVEEEIPVSQVAIQAAFRQSHDPVLPLGRAGHTDKEVKAPSSALWSGVQWWAALADHAHNNPSFAAMWSKVAPPTLSLSPPSRFVISIPSFFVSEDDEDDDDDDEDEDFEKVRVERMISFLRQLLEIPIEEVSRLRRSCRTQHGKLWTALRALSGSLILLRFTPSEDEQRSVDLTIQCSDLADLSAMRALVLEAINNWSDGVAQGNNVADCSEELALDMSELLEPIASLENILEDLKVKITTRFEDPASATCTDEMLHALSQLAHVETQTLTLYWKTRLHLNRTIM